MQLSRSPSPALERQEEAETMQIFVKQLDGDTITLNVAPSVRVANLRALLSGRTAIPPADVRLVYAGKQLSQPAANLADYAVQREATLHLVLPLRGGAGARRQRCTFKNCKDAAQRIVGDCGFCSGHFCGRHRLLEDHKCAGLEDCKKESHDANANKLISERTTVVRGV